MADLLGEDTIVALATPPGAGAIAMVRVSGPRAVQLVDGAFTGRRSLQELPSHLMAHGWLRGVHGSSAEVTIDEVMVVVHRAPHSYTGEDLVEITCHGSPLIVRQILQLFCARGARLAEPGEFTRRAFLHGRLDLAQAEAVCDLVQARTERARRASMAQLEGQLSQRIAQLQERLVDARALLELDIDFSDEDVPSWDRQLLARTLEEVGGELRALLRTFQQGRFLREGARVVLLGRTNVGKSSLLNALVESDRAIVSELPGTTRDTLEGLVDIGGFPVTVVDTAGFGVAGSEIEKEGLRRTEREVEKADVVILLLDGSEPLQAEDRRLLEVYVPGRGRTVIPAVNKIDLPRAWSPAELGAGRVVELSAKRRLGLEQLREAVVQALIGDGFAGAGDVVLTNARHWEALRQAEEAVRRAGASLAQGLSAEFIVVDLREASEALGRVVGGVSDEDILASIFARFCIGK
ncbi:MAG: tRNA uridine-5-carboxymethylaminomethyl(34) synthesis GTPase MnmE [bacterium]|nr:tRNA uridine-5-carboxymethylaminomethyl(34) synthesis GTPase MnmE [candidate division KSB1 bacterium]MDH7561194.1 tRNA uridine-5-carboxymethylaminomethyl(34) synthesis GTPase MnmE [bacterium]